MDPDGAGDVFCPTSRKRKSTRRSSILKIRSPARVLSNLDPNAQLEDDVITRKQLRRSKRVSFSATCQVKEFLIEGNWQKSNDAPPPPTSSTPQGNSEGSGPITGLDLLLKGSIRNSASMRKAAASLETSPVISADDLTGTSKPRDVDSETTLKNVSEVELHTTRNREAESEKMWDGQTFDKTYQFEDDNMDLTVLNDDVFLDAEPIANGSSAVSKILGAGSQLSADRLSSSHLNHSIINIAKEPTPTSLMKECPSGPELKSAAAGLRLSTGSKENSTQQSSGLNQTMLLTDDDAEMEMTACISGKINLGSQAEDRDESFVKVDFQSFLKRFERKANTCSTETNKYNSTRLFSEDSNTCGMDFTQCYTAAIETAPTENKLDATSALSRIMSAPKQNISDKLETVAMVDRTQLFLDEDAGGMDLTVCSHREEKIDAANALSRIMSAPKQCSNGTLASITSTTVTQQSSGLNRTMLLSDKNGEMEMTECITGQISPGDQGEDKDESFVKVDFQSFLRRLEGNTNASTVKTTDMNYTQIFSEDGNTGAMDFTQCHTAVIETEPQEKKLDAASALSRIMSAPKQAKSDIGIYNVANKTHISSEDGNTGTMDFTQCHTAAIETKPQEKKLDTASVLSRIMSAPKQVKGNIGIYNVANKTCIFSEDGTMDFTQCHTAPIETEPRENKLDTTSALSQIMSAPKQVKCDIGLNRTMLLSDKNGEMEMTACITGQISLGDQGEDKDESFVKVDFQSFLRRLEGNTNASTVKSTDMNCTQIFAEDGNTGAMDFTQCHTAVIETEPQEKKLDAASALSRIMSAPKQAKSDVGIYNVANKTHISSEDGNTGTMDFTQCHTAAIETKPQEKKLDTASVLSRIMSAPKQVKGNIGIYNVANKTCIFSEDATMDFTQCHTAPIETEPRENKLDTTSALSRIMSAPKQVKCDIGLYNVAKKTHIFSEDGNTGANNFTQCHTAVIETEPQEKKLDTASVLSQIISPPKQVKSDIGIYYVANKAQTLSENRKTIETAPIEDRLDTPSALSKIISATKHKKIVNSGNLVMADHTRLFSEDGNMGGMDFTECNEATRETSSSAVKCNTAAIPSRTIPQPKSDTKENIDTLTPAGLIALKGDLTNLEGRMSSNKTCVNTTDMDFTACNTGAIEVQLGTETNRGSHACISTKVGKSELEQTRVFEGGQDMEFTTCLSKTQQETLHDGHLDVDSNSVSEMQKQCKVDQTQLCNDSDMDFTLSNDAMIKVSGNTISSENRVACCIKAKNTYTAVCAKDTEVAECIIEPQLAQHENLAGTIQNKTINRSRLYSQGSDDMEFTGQITEVILSGVEAEQQQKENTSVCKPTKNRVGLTVRSDISTSEWKVPDVQPARAGLADITHHYSSNDPNSNMELTYAEMTIQNRTALMGESDSDPDILRPDDGVPIRLGRIAVPRITKDGCIYTQGTFDSSLKFLCEFEDPSPFKTGVETSSIEIGVENNQITKSTLPHDGSYVVLTTATESEPDKAVTKQKSSRTSSENQTMHKTGVTQQNLSVRNDETFRMDMPQGVGSISTVQTNNAIAELKFDSQSIQNLQNRTRYQDEDDTGAMEMTTCSGRILDQTQSEHAEPPGIGMDVHNSNIIASSPPLPDRSHSQIRKEVDLHISCKNKASLQAAQVGSCDVPDAPLSTAEKSIFEVQSTVTVDENHGNKAKIFNGNEIGTMDLIERCGQILAESKLLDSAKGTSEVNKKNVRTNADQCTSLEGVSLAQPQQNLKQSPVVDKTGLSACSPTPAIADLRTSLEKVVTEQLSSPEHLRSCTEMAVIEKITLSAYTPSSSMDDLNLSLESGVTGQQSMSTTQPIQSIMVNKSSTEKNMMSAYTPSSTMVELDLTLESVVAGQQSMSTTQPIQSMKHSKSLTEKSLMSAYIPSSTMVDMDLTLESGVAGRQSMSITQPIQSMKHSKSFTEKRLLSAYTPSSTMVDMDLTLESSVAGQQSMSTIQPTHTSKRNNCVAEKDALSMYTPSATMVDMDLSEDANFPATEDLMPLSFHSSVSRKRHNRSQDLEKSHEQFMLATTKVAKIANNADLDAQQENSGLSDQSTSNQLLKPVTKHQAPVKMQGAVEESTYSVPILGTSCSALSLMDISNLDDCQPQTIDDYLQMFNIRMTNARRNSTNIKAIQMEEPKDDVSRLKQTFIDAPHLELLKVYTQKLGERKARVAKALDTVETALMENPPAIFIEIQKASMDQVVAMRQKYKDLYKACSLNTKVSLKTVKCDFIQQVNMKYLEQVQTVEKIKGELLDKIDFSAEVLELIDEVKQKIEHGMETLTDEEYGTPEQVRRIRILDEKIMETKLLCASKEDALKNIKRQIKGASEKKDLLQGELSERLVPLFPPCYLTRRDEHLRRIQRLCLWHTIRSTPNEHLTAFLFDSLLLKLTFLQGNGSTTDGDSITDLMFTSKLAAKSADYAKISHQFVLSAVDGEKLRLKYGRRANVTAVLRDVAVQVAVAADLAGSVSDISVWNDVKVSGLVICVQFSSFGAFAKFTLTITINPQTYPMELPVWNFKSTIGAIRRADIEKVFQSVNPGLGYLSRLVFAVNELLCCTKSQ